MTELEITEIDRKSLITTLAIINDGFSFTKINNSIYNVKSLDSTINFNIDFNNETENSYEILKTMLEYSYNYKNYVMGELKDETDVLENFYKFANAIVLDINKEALELEEDKVIRNDDNIKPTPIQLCLFNRIIELEKLTYEVYEKEQNAYSAMVVARFIAESVQQANLFFHYLDLLDYVKVVYQFSHLIPCHDDREWLNFVTKMLAVKDAE
ncbi:MAG: hypothetical protein ACI4PF_04215 [Christensenellales bacterium]